MIDNDYNYNIAELLRKIRRGDSEAFENLINLKTEYLYKLSYQFLKDKMLAEDVVNQTFSKLIAACEKLKNEQNLNGWLNTIAVNLCLDVLKKRKREVFIEDSLTDIERKSLTDARDIVERIHIQNCLSTLSENERIILLYDYHGYSMRESIRLMGITTAQGRRLLMKAREHFKEYYLKE